MKRYRKRGFAFSFGWIFAIIVGAVIIFLAIYGTTKLIGTEKKIRDTEVGKEIGIILKPVETNIETSKISNIILKDNTKLYNDCNSKSGTFGTQKISVATESGIGNPDERGERISFKNKYIFSSEVVEGKKYIVFAKPLDMPFKIADLIYVLSVDDRYCFVGPPNEVEDEIEDLGINIVNITNNEGECPSGSEVVIFNGNKRLVKNFEEFNFEGAALGLGAAFSDKEIYECQVRRLMRRASELASIYRAKSALLAPKVGCGTNLEIDLKKYAEDTLNVESSEGLIVIKQLSDDLRRKNDDLYCKIF